MRAGLIIRLVVAVLPSVASIAEESREVSEIRANPIRKVVTMLQSMQKKVIAEGKEEAELYEKYMCYCKGGDAKLASSISAAGTKISLVSTSVREATAHKAQLEQELKDHQGARSDAKEAMAKATVMREEDFAAYSKESAEYKTNIAALEGAIKAVSGGMAGAFLQTDTAAVVRRLAINGPSMNDNDRQSLLSFLSGRQVEGYIPKSGEITGILQQLKDDMDKSLASITADETSSVVAYDELMAAKKKEVAVLTSAVETKSKRVGELAVQIAAESHDIEDTMAAMAADKSFLDDLSKDCATKTTEWEERKQTRAEELTTLADTIKVLNDDDALDLFKKTLPSMGLLQLQVNAKTIKTRALAFISKARQVHSPAARKSELDLIALALQGKKVGFEKVLQMIDNLVALLKKEQVSDDQKKEYCGAQFDEQDDKKKGLEQKISDHEKAIAEAGEGISALNAELKALEVGIKELDSSVADATMLRKKENTEYLSLVSSDSAAKEIIAWAKNRLAKFYAPKLYKAPPKRELTEEEGVVVGLGGTLEPTAPPGGIANTGIEVPTLLLQASAHRQYRQEAPPPPPETYGAYASKSQESLGVMAMMDLLVKDLDKEMTEAGVEEKEAQAEYEEMMKDSAAKRAADAKSITSKQAMKAELEGAVEEHDESKASATRELATTLEYIASLHAECDWLVKYYDVRKEARDSEISSLTSAKAVLSGADFAFLQASSGLKARRIMRHSQ